MKKGDFIKISYTGRLESGELFVITAENEAKKNGVFDEKMKYSPVTIIIGANFLVPGLDKAVESMEVGDKKDVEVAPEEGFGQRDPNLVKTVNKNVFRDTKLNPQAGMIVNFSGTKGRIQSIAGGRVRVDFNNPLAGKKLLYHIEITEKIEGTENKINSLLEFFGISGAILKIEGNEAEITSRMPDRMKETLSDLITKHVEGITKVKFAEVYEKK